MHSIVAAHGPRLRRRAPVAPGCHICCTRTPPGGQPHRAPPATNGWARHLLIITLLALATQLAGCAWLELKQRQWALRPTPGRPAQLPPDAELFRPGDVRTLVPVPGADSADQSSTEQLALWWLPHANPNAPALLYLHGTFRNLYLNLPKIDALRAAGFSVLAVDYRGWGDSTPIIPSEESITADAARAWAEMQRRQPVATRRVIFGHSMGGAVAVRLAGTLHGGTDYGALVVESTFTRIADIAAEAGFWGRRLAGVTTLEFDSIGRIGRIDAPLWILHGDADRTVPIRLGRRLRDAAPPGTHWVEVPGGTHSRLHSDAAELYRRTFADVIRALATPASAATPTTPPNPFTPPTR